MRHLERRKIFITSLVILLLLATALHAADSSSRPPNNSPEAYLFDAANRERTAAGLPAFAWDQNLAAAARAHAQLMVQRNALSHQFPGEPPMQERAEQAGARFSMLAENVALGPTAQGLHAQWMHSPPHRANLLDRDLNSIGIAVVQSGNTFFAVQDFAVAVPHLSFAQQEAQLSAQLADRGLRVEKDSTDARKTCAMDRGWSGPRPLATLRYEASDLSRLPEDVVQKVQSGKYHSAAVGACEASGSGVFTRFRFAILLF